MTVSARGRWLWIAAAVTIGLGLTPWDRQILYPFKLFTTWVHECGHAVMALLVGGRVGSITIAPDTSGLTRSLIPSSPLARGLVSSAGYLGASIVGCLLMAAARVERRTHSILWGIGAFMLLTVLLWIRNFFGFVVVLAWGAALIALARKRHAGASQFVLSLLAIQVALNAVYDIRALFLVGEGHSDAQAMAQLFLAPAWLWASAWMVMSVAMLAWTLWATRR
jgi:peptidase M50B-like protein